MGMEKLIKKTRAIFTERKIPPLKTQSFKEKRRSSSWITRQSSRKMSWDYVSSDDDYWTAVAAVAHAIHSLEESKPRDQNETTYGRQKFLNKVRSRAEDAGILPEPHRSPLKFSDETQDKIFGDPDMRMPTSSSTSTRMPEKAVHPAPSFKENTSSSDSEDETNINKSSSPTPEKAPEPGLSMRRRPTFRDKHLHKDDNRTVPEIPVTKPDRPPIDWSSNRPVETGTQSAINSGPRNSIADAWEKEEMASIKERCEELKAVIDNWEINKKKKADQKLEKKRGELGKERVIAMERHSNERLRATTERWDINKKKKLDQKLQKIEDNLDKRRAKAEESKRDKIKRIEEIAGGAKAQAEENRRNEELKVKEKANVIRSTGKLPPTCLCF